MEIFMRGGIYIGVYTEIILSLSRFSLCLQRDRPPDKIWIVSNSFK